MTIAPESAQAAPLLPTREAALARLTEQLPATEGTPACLLVIGLRQDDGRPAPASTLEQVTMLLARSLRAEDWLAGAGTAEFAVVMCGPAVGGRVAADRLVAAIGALGIPGLSAAAGIAALAAHLDADEALRRATVSLTAARRVGAGTVVQYREPY